MAPAHQCERRLGGAEDAHRFVVRRRCGEPARMGVGGGTLAGRNDEARQPAEWRIAGLLTHLDLAGVERLAVAGDQRLHDRMIGLVRLQEADAAACLAAGAAGDLVQQLEGALGCARIAVGEAEIGVDDADQVELGEMMSLGDQLGADDDVDMALGDLLQFLAHLLDRRDQVARQHQHARVGKQLHHLLFQPLDARPAGDECVGRLALRANLRLRHGEAAMMTDQLAPESMVDQPGVAVRTGKTVAAGAAQGQRRVAAAVEKQKRLLLALERDLDCLDQPRRDEASARRALSRQVDRLDRR